MISDKSSPCESIKGGVTKSLQLKPFGDPVRRLKLNFGSADKKGKEEKVRTKVMSFDFENRGKTGRTCESRESSEDRFRMSEEKDYAVKGIIDKVQRDNRELEEFNEKIKEELEKAYGEWKSSISEVEVEMVQQVKQRMNENSRFLMFLQAKLMHFDSISSLILLSLHDSIGYKISYFSYRLDYLQKCLKVLGKGLKFYRNSCVALQNSKKSVENEKKILEEKLEIKENLVISLNNAVENINNAKDYVDKVVNYYENKKILEIFLEKIQAFEENVEEMKNYLQGNSKTKNYSKENQELKENILDLREELKQLKLQKGRGEILQEEIRKLKQENTDFSLELQEKCSQIQVLQSENSRMTEKISQMHEKYSKLHERNTSLAHTYNDLHHQYSEAEKKLKADKISIENLENSLESCEEQLKNSAQQLIFYKLKDYKDKFLKVSFQKQFVDTKEELEILTKRLVLNKLKEYKDKFVKNFLAEQLAGVKDELKTASQQLVFYKLRDYKNKFLRLSSKKPEDIEADSKLQQIRPEESKENPFFHQNAFGIMEEAPSRNYSGYDLYTNEFVFIEKLCEILEISYEDLENPDVTVLQLMELVKIKLEKMKEEADSQKFLILDLEEKLIQMQANEVDLNQKEESFEVLIDSPKIGSESLLRQINDLTKNEKKLEMYIDQLKEIIKLKEEIEKELNEKIKEMELHIRNKNAIKDTDEKCIHFQEASINELELLRNKIKVLVEDSNRLQDQCKSYEIQLEIAQAENKNMQKSLMNTSKSFNDSLQKISGLNSELEAFKSKSQEITQLYEESKRQDEIISKKLHHYKKKSKKLSKQTELYLAQIQNLEESEKLLSENLSKVQQDLSYLSSIQEKLEKYKSSNKANRRLLKTANKDYDSLLSDYTSLKTCKTLPDSPSS